MIRIVIAEDQKMMLGALSSLLDLEDDLTVAATAANGEDAEKAVREHDPDVCLLDIEMPKMSGLEAAEKLADHPCRILILTTFSRSGYFQRAVKAGVHGYMLKDSPSEELADAIRKIMQGKKVYAPELIDHVYSSENPLTDREIDVLHLMAEGNSTKAIAAELFLTNGTVRNYISSILEKLEVDNRIEAITVYKEKGWSK
ncbi:response regulator transcription factor [Salisediminibacterium halotolerans]|uniref:Two-component system, NarL family, response regulator DesR n=1 Tax=Salisediminibacterium halotolerans TaxID=517425 RepID=A0A1H9WKM1_9BACI|nr:response regulator transcription factor [Salisediminibacterium haloalkalitolerans]SES34415.1 two-component system, NarL family, response regulator DesR [Salisediminibacterium haloalkalitolerans]